MPGQPPCAPGMSRDRLHCPPKLFPNDPHSCEYATKEGDKAPLQGRCSANVHLSEGPDRHQSCCYVQARLWRGWSPACEELSRRFASRFWMGSTRPVRPRRGKRGGGMLSLLSRLLREQTAQDLAEYGIALATISIVAIVVAIIVAGDVGTLWSRAQSVINSAAS